MKLRTWLGWIAPHVLWLGLGSQAAAESGPTEAVRSQQHLFCNTGYAEDACREQLQVLKGVLAKYDAEILGEWTWILVKSQDWKGITKALKLNPYSPSFTCLEKKETFVEEALVTKVKGRGAELVTHWHLGTKELLDLAVAHEMGHGLCNSANEDEANHIATQLQADKVLSCEVNNRITAKLARERLTRSRALPRDK